jgi:hypothetical protein
MTIDAPYACCWSWALVFGYVAVFQNRSWAWPVAGMLTGLGILAKYTMVLWIPSLALFLITNRQYRPLVARTGPWIMSGVAALCCLPILIWNMQNSWVTFQHVFGLAGLANQRVTVHWLGPVQFLATQFALWLGYWFIAWAAAMVVHRPWRERCPELQYLWWMSAPVFTVFWVFSLKTGGGEPNWPITAYVSGLVLAAGWLVRQL